MLRAGNRLTVRQVCATVDDHEQCRDGEIDDRHRYVYREGRFDHLDIDFHGYSNILTLLAAWNAIASKTLPPVLLYTHVIITDVPIVCKRYNTGGICE